MAESVDSNNDGRDKHLRGADFFSVKEFPEIRFVGKTFESAGENKVRITGDLTFHGVTREETTVLESTHTLPELGQEDMSREFSLAYMQRIVDGLIRDHEGRKVPVILFTKNGGQWLESIADSGCDAVFDAGFERLSVTDHAALMWENGHLPSVGPTLPNAPMNVSEKMGAIELDDGSSSSSTRPPARSFIPARRRWRRQESAQL